MPMWLAILVLVLLILMVVGFVWMAVWLRRSNIVRKDDQAGPLLAELAAQHGWLYEPENVGFADRIPGYPVFGSSDSESRQLVHGTHRGREFGFFQYCMHTGGISGGEASSGSSLYIRVYAVEVPVDFPMPLVFVASNKTVKGRPRKKKAVVTNDSQFEASCYASSNDPRFAHAVLSEPVRKQFALDTRLRDLKLKVSFQGTVIYHAYEQKTHLDTSSVEPTLDFLCDVLDRIPAGALR